MPANWLGRHWTWQNRVNATLGLLICAGIVAFLGVSVVSNYTAASDAVSSLNRARELTSSRITKLNGQIAMLSRQNAKAQRQRGLLLAEVQVLTEQLQALGVAPAATPPASLVRDTPTTTSRTPKPSPTVTVTVHPKPSRTPSPTPKPRPSKSCLIKVTTVCL